MNKVRFETDKKKINKSLPEEWNELTPEQVRFIAPRVFLAKKSQELKSEILFHLLKLKEKYIRLMNMSQLEALLPAIEWLFEEPNLTINPFPKIKTKNLDFYGPQNAFRELTTAQFAFADRFFNLFLLKKSEKNLDLMLGTLYSRNKKFVKEEIEYNAKALSEISLDKKLSVLLYFMGSRNQMGKAHADIFNQKNTRSTRKSKSGWLGFFYRMAGPKTGTYEEVAGMNFMDMLGIMAEINEEARETEKNNRRR